MSVKDDAIDPAPIYSAATAFWKSAVLFAACRLRMFDALEEPAGAGELAERLELSERGTLALLDACVALDLLETTEGRYRTTPASERYLTTRSPESLLVTLELQANTYPMWMDLSESVRNGRPAIPPGDLLGDDKELGVKAPSLAGHSRWWGEYEPAPDSWLRRGYPHESHR